MDIYTLKQFEIKDVVDNLKYTFHAKKRIEERLPDGDVKKMAKKYNFAYVNTDGFINMALSKQTYLVVKPVKRDEFLCITYKEPSHNGYTIHDKYKLAKKGISR